MRWESTLAAVDKAFERKSFGSPREASDMIRRSTLVRLWTRQVAEVFGLTVARQLGQEAP
jgi:hypothetical protein